MIFKIKVPMVGESVTEVVVGEWKKQDGDIVAIDDPVCIIESEKAAMEIAAEKAGRLKIKAQAGDTLNIGDVLAEIDTSVSIDQQPHQQPHQQPETTESKKRLITPVAQMMLKEADIPIEQVKGSGPMGKITKADALQAIEGDKPKPTEEPRESREPMSTLRQTIARHLVQAKNETAMLTTINEIDMSEVLKLREELREEFQEKYGVKLGFMSFFGRAVCIALTDMPVVNARLEGKEILYHHYVDLSIAVSTPRGLVVPVIGGAHRLSIGELENQIQTLAQKARDGKLTLQEMTGGTFTITNGGVFGSLISTPIINTPQSAVLGLHVIQKRPVALQGQVVIRPMMYVSLSYDHRLIDGRESVLFLVHLKKLLENPYRMLLKL